MAHAWIGEYREAMSAHDRAPAGELKKRGKVDSFVCAASAFPRMFT
jgi:hypothetical protein